MKQIIALLLIVIGTFSMDASTPPEGDITITLCHKDDEPNEDDYPAKGPRSYRVPITCIINFTENTITTTIPYVIVSYELWDVEDEMLIASCTTEYEMVEYMSTLTGTYQLRLVTDTYTYIGYITL